MWPVRSQEAALAWTVEQKDRCPGCGTFTWEWDEDPHAYQAVSYQCLGCLKRDTESERLQKQKGRKGMHIGLQRRQP